GDGPIDVEPRRCFAAISDVEAMMRDPEQFPVTRPLCKYRTDIWHLRPWAVLLRKLRRRIGAPDRVRIAVRLGCSFCMDDKRLVARLQQLDWRSKARKHLAIGKIDRAA